MDEILDDFMEMVDKECILISLNNIVIFIMFVLWGYDIIHFSEKNQ